MDFGGPNQRPESITLSFTGPVKSRSVSTAKRSRSRYDDPDEKADGAQSRDSKAIRDTLQAFSLERITWQINFRLSGVTKSRERSAARLQARKEAGINHRKDSCTEETNTDEPRYEKAVAQKFFGKNDDG